jgi:hypothetical protein
MIKRNPLSPDKPAVHGTRQIALPSKRYGAPPAGLEVSPGPEGRRIRGRIVAGPVHAAVRIISLLGHCVQVDLVPEPFYARVGVGVRGRGRCLQVDGALYSSVGGNVWPKSSYISIDAVRSPLWSRLQIYGAGVARVCKRPRLRVEGGYM